MRIPNTAVALLGVAFLLAGCTAAPSSTTPSAKATPTPTPVTVRLQASHGVVDPLEEVTDRADPRYLRGGAHPLLHVSAVGPHAYPVAFAGAVRSVRVYLACAPQSTFTVRIGKRFSGPCDATFQNFADIPYSGARRITVDVPAATRYALLVIPTPAP